MKLPPLRKKGRTWEDVDPDSLTAALHHQELQPKAEEPEAPEAAEEIKEPATVAKRPRRPKKNANG